MNNMRCAIYARTATTDQSCEKQLQELRDYVAHQGWTVGGEYMDTGRSGTGPRPSLTRLMQHAREGGLDAVVVMRLDRWGRNIAHSLGGIEELHTLKVRWISVAEGLDIDGSAESLSAVRLIQAARTFTAESKLERVAAGMRLARQRGVHMGRPKLVFDREQVVALRDQGNSIRQIAAKLGVGKGTIERILSVPKG